MGNADVRPHWMPDNKAEVCSKCKATFSMSERKHHCRQCGNIFCDACTPFRYLVRYYPDGRPRRICENCNKLDGYPPVEEYIKPELDETQFWDKAKQILATVEERTSQLSESEMHGLGLVELRHFYSTRQREQFQNKLAFIIQHNSDKIGTLESTNDFFYGTRTTTKGSL